MKPKAPLGADLVIPALALGFAAYFFVSVEELAWEAKANAVLVGAILVVLVVLQLARIARQLARGEGDLGLQPLWRPVEATAQRLGLAAVAAAFIAALPWLGLTLALLAAMLAALLVMGVRRRAVLVWLPLAVAAAAYLLFVVALQSELPHGPIEKLLS